jgi:hypothetical protein
MPLKTLDAKDIWKIYDTVESPQTKPVQSTTLKPRNSSEDFGSENQK